MYKNINYQIVIRLICTVFCINFSSTQAEDLKTINANEVYTFNINSSINPATLSYLRHGLEKEVKLSKNSIVLIKLNTPGGLVSTTKKIISLIRKSNRPIIIWVTPEGSSATSAGAILASTAHFIFMSPGTNIGAATPVQMGSDIKQSDQRSKAINDLVGLTRSLAESRNHNADAFEEMITKASSFTAKNALSKKIINGVVSNIDEIYKYINNKEIIIQGKEYKLKLDNNIKNKNIKMDIGQNILNFFANPSLAYMLFIIGALFIYFELQAPGGFIPGLTGLILIILSGISFQILPINVGALTLIALSLILFIAEIYVTSYGVLSVLGLISLFLGSSYLYRSNDTYLDFNLNYTYAIILAISCYMMIIASFILKPIRKNSFFNLVGNKGIILRSKSSKDKYYYYQIKLNSAIWNARSEDKLIPKDTIVVSSYNEENKLLLNIKKYKRNKE
jgi:membrane-bound serine protease (ClpP class)